MLSSNDFRINVASRTSKRTIKTNVAAGHYLINSGFFEQHISARLPSFFALDVPQIPQKCRIRGLRKAQPLLTKGSLRAPFRPLPREYALPAPAYSSGRGGPMRPCKFAPLEEVMD